LLFIFVRGTVQKTFCYAVFFHFNSIIGNYAMAKKRLSKSLRKFIRREKARIRREVLDRKEQEKLIEELYQKITFKRPSA